MTMEKAREILDHERNYLDGAARGELEKLAKSMEDGAAEIRAVLALPGMTGRRAAARFCNSMSDPTRWVRHNWEAVTEAGAGLARLDEAEKYLDWAAQEIPGKA